MNVGENVEVASIAKVREEKLEDEMEKKYNRRIKIKIRA